MPVRNGEIMVKIVCVDDESIILRQTIEQCGHLPQVGEVIGFQRAGSALEWFGDNTADIALLDINLPDMNGIALAVHIREKSPDTAVIFVTGYSEYAVDAFKIHAAGYLLKPVTSETLAAEIDHALSLKGRSVPVIHSSHIAVRTFGKFEILVDNKPVRFARSRSKELLSILVSRRGGQVSRNELHNILYSDREYDRPMQKQLDVMIRSMRDTLVEYGIGDILVINRGLLSIRPELIDCDMYRLMDGDPEAVNSYRGEYMTGYSWADNEKYHLIR